MRTDTRKIVLLSLFLVGLGTIYYLTVSRTEKAVKVHPLDKTIASQLKASWRAASMNEILRSADARADLNLNERQRAQVDDLLRRQEVEAEELWAAWREENPNEVARPFRAVGVEELVLRTHRQTLKILDSDQQARLRQLELQAMGWRFVFVETVKKQLSLTAEQLKKFKDLELKKTRLGNWLATQQRNADSDQRLDFQKRYEQQIDELNEKCLEVLTPEQQELRDRMLGPPLILPEPVSLL